MSSVVVLGLDGGGTRTRALLADGAGRTLGTGEAGPGNLHDLGEEAVLANVRAAVAVAWGAAGQEARAVHAVFAGLAGLVTDPDRLAAEGVLRRLDLAPGAPVEVDHDLRIAFAGALGAGPGVVLIAGTGSSCLACNADGATRLVGGWGRTLDDAGSAYDLGLQALRAVVRAEDGRRPATALRQEVLAAFGAKEPRELMGILDRGLAGNRSEIAGLAPAVLGLAAVGEATASELLARGVEELATLVAVAVEGLLAGGAPNVPVAVVGGLVGAGDAFLGPLWNAIERRAPRARRVEPRSTPLEGAAWLAGRLLVNSKGAR